VTNHQADARDIELANHIEAARLDERRKVAEEILAILDKNYDFTCNQTALEISNGIRLKYYLSDKPSRALQEEEITEEALAELNAEFVKWKEQRDKPKQQIIELERQLKIAVLVLKRYTEADDFTIWHPARTALDEIVPKEKPL
jgi:hypothetical protein